MQNRSFAVQLRSLMKQRKISGEKIAQKLNVSQKTISRYSTGEIVPRKEVQKSIFRIISEIGGHPEDATIDLTDNFITLNKLEQYKDYIINQDELDCIEYQLLEQYEHDALLKFSLLQPKNQTYILKNYENLRRIKKYELQLLSNWNDLSCRKRDFILKNLELVQFNFENIKGKEDVCQKIRDYSQMIFSCKDAVKEDIEQITRSVKNGVSIQTNFNDNCKIFAEKLKQSIPSEVETFSEYLLALILIDSPDFYFLMLIQIMCLNDMHFNEDRFAVEPLYGTFVGDRLYSLFNYIEQHLEG